MMAHGTPSKFEVRGPWRSSPGNPYPWQAAYYTGGGWAYSFSKISGLDALRAARASAKELATQEKQAWTS